MILPDWPAPAAVFAATTTRDGGCSSAPYQSFNLATHVGDDPDCVAENRHRLRQRLALPEHPRWLNQVHGVDVVCADALRAPVDADGAWTTTPGVVCAVQTADCLPVLFCNREGTRVAAAHAGWAGLLAGVLAATRATFAGDGEVLAWLGPAISQPHYEVGPELRAAFLDAAPAAQRAQTAAAFLPAPRAGHWLADLYALARLQLQGSGVRVFGGDLCTAADPQRFYSYRRDGATGRMASLIYIKP